jgi:periplasmic copper chaperone A
MKKILFVFILGTLLFSACASDMTKDVTIKNFWARSGMKDDNSAVYMFLQNDTKQEDELIGVFSDVAQAVEIHLSRMKTDGTMEMIQQKSIALPAGGEVELKPGSYHVMLIGLKQDLKAGNEFPLTLYFKNHEDITLSIPVMEAENMEGSGMDGHMP